MLRKVSVCINPNSAAQKVLGISLGKEFKDITGLPINLVFSNKLKVIIVIRDGTRRGILPTTSRRESVRRYVVVIQIKA